MLVFACGQNQNETAEPAPAEVPLGSHTYKITASVPAAQHAFDRGLTLKNNRNPAFTQCMWRTINTSLPTLP